MVEYSGTDPEFRELVRGALGGASQNFITDKNIKTQRKVKVEPFITDSLEQPDKVDQSKIDNAIITYTAYRAFGSIPIASTVSGGGLTANLSPSQYVEQLEHDASVALERIGLSLPEGENPVEFVDSTDGIFR